MKKLLASLAITALTALPVAAQDLGRQVAVAVLEAHQAVLLAVVRLAVWLALVLLERLLEQVGGTAATVAIAAAVVAAVVVAAKDDANIVNNNNNNINIKLKLKRLKSAFFMKAFFYCINLKNFPAFIL